MFISLKHNSQLDELGFQAWEKSLNGREMKNILRDLEESISNKLIKKV